MIVDVDKWIEERAEAVGCTDPDTNVGATLALRSMRPLIEAAMARVVDGHGALCPRHELSSRRSMTCICGHDALADALRELGLGDE